MRYAWQLSEPSARLTKAPSTLEETRSSWLKLVRCSHTTHARTLADIFIGKDATEAFEDVGHSDEARALLPPMLVGAFEKDGVSNTPCLPAPSTHLSPGIKN